jgi:hypothetical protein
MRKKWITTTFSCVHLICRPWYQGEGGGRIYPQDEDSAGPTCVSWNQVAATGEYFAIKSLSRDFLEGEDGIVVSRQAVGRAAGRARRVCRLLLAARTAATHAKWGDPPPGRHARNVKMHACCRRAYSVLLGAFVFISCATQQQRGSTLAPKHTTGMMQPHACLPSSQTSAPRCIHDPAATPRPTPN